MKKYSPAKMLFTFLGLATFASLVGTVSGTLAWYAFSTQAMISYSGTSVSNNVQLQIGIASENEVISLEEIRERNAQLIANNPDMTEEELNELASIEDMFVEFWNTVESVTWSNDDTHYYFAPHGSDLSSPVINAYLYSNGYATNKLAPVTSGAYKRGDAFSLKASPNSVQPHVSKPASKSYYATIPMVFRVLVGNTTQNDNYVVGAKLWLTDAQVKAASENDGNIYKAIRIFVDRSDLYEDDFILNPSQNETGNTIVGGVLDLNGDHFYDSNLNGDEILYGDFEHLDGLLPSYSGPDEIVDINNTGKTGDDYDTFTAKHRSGVNYYDNYNSCILKSAEYESLTSVAPAKDDLTGVLSDKDPNHPTSVCITAGVEDHYLGRVTLTTYIEGWDHSVIDEEQTHMFDLGLKFEVNSLGA